jgi:hypothetical protein
MGRSLLFGMVMCAILLAAATTRSDVAPSPDATATDPSTDTADTADAATAPAETPVQKDPFAPYDVGRPEGIWPYEALVPEERAVVDRGRDASSWQATHDAFAAAVLERSIKARAEAAQHTLGVDGLETGVVP